MKIAVLCKDKAEFRAFQELIELDDMPKFVRISRTEDMVGRQFDGFIKIGRYFDIPEHEILIVRLRSRCIT